MYDGDYELLTGSNMRDKGSVPQQANRKATLFQALAIITLFNNHLQKKSQEQNVRLIWQAFKFKKHTVLHFTSQSFLFSEIVKKI